MRFKINQWFKQILITIIIIFVALVDKSYQSINVSQSDPIVSIGNHNHITASDRPQHYCKSSLPLSHDNHPKGEGRCPHTPICLKMTP